MGGEVCAPRNANFGNPMASEFQKEKRNYFCSLDRGFAFVYTLGANYKPGKN